MKAKQAALKMPPTRPRTDAAFRRKGSRYWQVRIWIGEKSVRRSTRAITKSGAETMLPLLRRHLESPRPATQFGGGGEPKP